MTPGAAAPGAATHGAPAPGAATPGTPAPTAPASASSATPAPPPLETRVVEVPDPVAEASAAEAADSGPDDGRGRRPPSVGLMWTDALGRAATRSLQVLLIIGLAALVIWGGLQVSIVVIPVLLALIISSAASPLVTKLRDWGWPSSIATIIVLLAVVLLLGGVIWMVVMLIENQWEELRDNAVDGFNHALGWVESTFGLVIDAEQLAQWYEQVRDFVFTSQFGSAAATGVTAGISAIATFATSAVLFVVVLFFFMKDGPLIWNFLLRPAKGARKRRFKLMGQRAVSVMGGYVRGTVIVALVDAVFIGIGLWIIGVPLAFPLAVIVFICAFIPIVGATLAGVIAALVTLVTNGMWEAVAVVIIVVVVNQLEGNFLQPIVLGRSLKLHALVVLIALTVGTILGGIVGTLLSVPIAAVGWALIVAWNEPLPELEEATGKGWFGRDPNDQRRLRGRRAGADAKPTSASQPRLPEVARPGDADAR